MEGKPSLDIQTASIEEFCAIGGLTRREAEAIVDWRAAHGPLHSFEELRHVPGVDEETLRKVLRAVDFGRE